MECYENARLLCLRLMFIYVYYSRGFMFYDSFLYNAGRLNLMRMYSGADTGNLKEFGGVLVCYCIFLPATGTAIYLFLKKGLCTRWLNEDYMFSK